MLHAILPFKLALINYRDALLRMKDMLECKAEMDSQKSLQMSLFE